MAVYPGFCGGTAKVQSPNVNAERTLNWMPFQAPGLPKANPWLAATPCVTPWVVLNNGPVRALFAQDGRMFAVSGTSFYEVFATHTATLRGTAALDGRPATISSNGTNGNQLFVTSGGNGYIYNLTTNVITLITDPDFPQGEVEMGWFSDGYFGVLLRGTNEFRISALFDGTDWDPLDVFQTSTTSDLTVAQLVSHRELYTLGSEWTAVWQDTGDDPVYQPIGGVSIEMGCAAAYSAVNLDNTVYFLGQNPQGARMVYRFNGYSPVRVSNDAIEFLLSQYPRVNDAIAWTYQEAGHTFYCLYLPAKPQGAGVWHTTLVYDVATGQWHERALWDPVEIEWVPHVGRCHCYAFNRHFIGARNSAAIYEYSMNLTLDTLVT